MPKIFDNIENYLTKGLADSLEVSHRADFCVGYFNLRGWKEVADKIDLFSGNGNEIDKVLTEHYGFTEEELDFIINYDIKYRMGKELEEDKE